MNIVLEGVVKPGLTLLKDYKNSDDTTIITKTDLVKILALM